MIFRLILLMTLGAMLSLTTSCGLVARAFRWGSKKKQADESRKEMFIGVVDLVNPEQHFVLVRTAINMALKTGVTLETRSPEGVKATLVVTPEHKTNYLSADITSGTPHRGDVVLIIPPEKSPDDGTIKDPASPLKPYQPSEADAMIPGQVPSPSAATLVPGVAPADSEMVPGVAPKNLPPSAPSRIVPGTAPTIRSGTMPSGPGEPLPPPIKGN